MKKALALVAVVAVGFSLWAYRLKVTSPAGGTYLVGDNIRVEWRCDLCPTGVTLYLMRSGRIILKMAEINHLAETPASSSEKVFSYEFPLPAGLAQGYGYYIKLVCRDGRIARSSYFTIKVPSPPRIYKFEARPNSIFRGQEAELRWRVYDAFKVTIEPGVGEVDPHSGKVKVKPLRTTTYTLRAEGPGGSSSRSITVQVRRKAVRPFPKTGPFVLSVINHGPIRFEINKASRRASVYFAGQHVFNMEAVEVVLKGHGPHDIIRLTGNNRGTRVFLDLKNKRIFIYERNRREVVWARKLHIYHRKKLLVVEIRENHLPISLKVDPAGKKAIMKWGSVAIFRLTARYTTPSIAMGMRSALLLQLQGNGPIIMFVDLQAGEIFFKVRRKIVWAKVRRM